MEDDVHREGQAELPSPSASLRSSSGARVARDSSARSARPLWMLPGRDRCPARRAPARRSLRERDAARDEVRRRARAPCAGDEHLEVLPRERLAAGEMDLHDAERLGLAEDAAPLFGRELVRRARRVGRVRAVRALERAPVRELGDERVRARRFGSRASIIARAAPCRGARTRTRRRRCSIAPPWGALGSRDELVGDVAHRARAVAALRDRGRGCRSARARAPGRGSCTCPRGDRSLRRAFFASLGMNERRSRHRRSRL